MANLGQHPIQARFQQHTVPVNYNGLTVGSQYAIILDGVVESTPLGSVYFTTPDAYASGIEIRGTHTTGNDVLYGGKGSDALWGDYGDDTLSGGAGADTFWIRAGDGHDVITDFNAAEGDRIGLMDGLSYTTRTNAAGEAVIVFSDGNDLTLQGVVGLSPFFSTVPASWFVRG